MCLSSGLNANVLGHATLYIGLALMMQPYVAFHARIKFGIIQRAVVDALRSPADLLERHRSHPDRVTLVEYQTAWRPSWT
jgi:hypothetical protein